MTTTRKSPDDQTGLNKLFTMQQRETTSQKLKQNKDM